MHRSIPSYSTLLIELPANVPGRQQMIVQVLGTLLPTCDPVIPQEFLDPGLSIALAVAVAVI